MVKQSAGILLFRLRDKSIEVFLVHPGGPFFVKKDLGIWSIPKGEFDESEDALEVAKREFAEETGQEISGRFIELNPITQKNGKIVYAWAVEGDIRADVIVSNTFELEWPPHTGNIQEFPEVDKGAWFGAATAKTKINPRQGVLIDQLLGKLRDLSDAKD